MWVQSLGWIWRVSKKCHCHRVRTALMRVLQQPPLHTNWIFESTRCYRPNLNFLQKAKFTVSQQQNAPKAGSENIYSAALTWGYNSQYFSNKSSAWKHHSAKLAVGAESQWPFREWKQANYSTKQRHKWHEVRNQLNTQTHRSKHDFSEHRSLVGVGVKLRNSTQAWFPPQKETSC